MVLFDFHFDLAQFPFPVSTIQFIGMFWKNRCGGMNNVAPIVLAQEDTANIIGSVLHPALIGKARRLWAKQGEFPAPIKKFRGFFFLRCTSPISGVKIAAPIVLTQYKGHKRIDKAGKLISHALHIVT